MNPGVFSSLELCGVLRMSDIVEKVLTARLAHRGCSFPSLPPRHYGLLALLTLESWGEACILRPAGREQLLSHQSHPPILTMRGCPMCNEVTSMW